MPGEPILVLNTVGLTARLLPLAPSLGKLAAEGWLRSAREPLPAVTSTAQATMLTGRLPSEHGIVANGWLFRDTMEVRFWQQSNRLLQAEPVYDGIRRARLERGMEFTVAKLFWWFNQGAGVDLAVTPKPHYGSDGDKRFDIDAVPRSAKSNFERLGPFPFPAFWGPTAGRASTDWIARAAELTVRRGGELLGDRTRRPFDLILVYLPHLDYDPQRHGPSGCDLATVVGELDAMVTPLIAAARSRGYRVLVVNEYGHVNVRRAVLLNRRFRAEGLLEVRDGPFGPQLDPFESRAFAVCDHQLAHVYTRRAQDRGKVAALVAAETGVARVAVDDERGALGLAHPRAGEIVALAESDAWFAYPWWADGSAGPDYARSVDIHRKPGFDPGEMFWDRPEWSAKLRAARRLIGKKLGFRTRFDVISTDPALVRGSHGLAAADPLDRPLLLGDASLPPPSADPSLAEVHSLLTAGLVI
jgi:predicted AlkP superfamily pyrophosphatase or phosphodiesterase